MMSVGVIVNSKAKNADFLSLYLDAFSKHNINYVLYQIEPEHLDKTLHEAKEKHPILLVGGGDGTIRSAAQACVRSTTILGVLPLGTLNHFAQELNLPQSAEEIIRALKKNKTITIDVAEVNNAVFINNSSIGFYPYFAKRRDYYTKFYNKWLSYIPGFLDALSSHPTFYVHIKNETFTHRVKTSFLMISNNLYSYEFPLKFSREYFNKSLLGIYFFKHGTLRLMKLIHYFLKKRTSFEIKQTEKPIEIQMDGGEEINVSLDGEVIKMKSPLRYQSLSKALTVLTRE